MAFFYYDQKTWDGLSAGVERIAPWPRFVLGTLLSLAGFGVAVYFLTRDVIHLWAIIAFGVGQAMAWSGKYDLKRMARMDREIAILQDDGERLALEVARMKKRGENPIQYLVGEGLSFVQTRSLVLRWAKELTREGRV